MSPEQRRKLNAMCGDLAAQVRFDSERGIFVNVRQCPEGRRWHKDDFRHALAGKAKGETERYMPDWDDSQRQITLGVSSLRLSDSEAADAIELAYYVGTRCLVRWSDPKEQAALAAYEVTHERTQAGR